MFTTTSKFEPTTGAAFLGDIDFVGVAFRSLDLNDILGIAFLIVSSNECSISLIQDPRIFEPNGLLGITFDITKAFSALNQIDMVGHFKCCVPLGGFD